MRCAGKYLWMMKKILVTFLSLFSFVSAEQVTILGINDMHAHIDRLPQLATFLKQERAARPDVLLFSAGDHRTGNPYVDIGEVPGLAMIELMNALRVDVSALGNHEFDSGLEALRRCMAAADFPFVCANVRSNDGGEFKAEPYRILERGGVRIGVLGLVQTSEGDIPDVHPERVSGLKFREPLSAVRDYVYLRERCDVLILLTHLGFETDVKLAALFPEADAIVGGHSHTRVDGAHVENGVLITQAQNKVKYITRLTFEVEEGKVIGKKAELISLANLPQDADMLAAVKAVKNSPHMLRQLTSVRKDIDNRESLGCLMTDALRAAAGTQIAVLNRGSVRLEEFPAGPFRVEDCYRLDPFGNKTVVMKVTGKELVEFIDAVTASGHYGPPCVSGMRIVTTAQQPMEIAEACLEDGTPIDPEAIYTMATSNYLTGTVSVVPADSGSLLDIDAATALLQFLDGRPSIDYSSVSRTGVSTK